MRQLFAFITAVCFMGCQHLSMGNATAKEVAGNWAEAYFNYDFTEAIQYVTPESEQWLRFAASNVTEQDLEALTEAAETELTDFTPLNDTLGMATIHVSNYLKMDSIGRAGSRQAQGLFRVTVIKRDGQWMVRMAGLPRSERQSLD